MNYIYDILLNFIDSERVIEFYEWNEFDCYETIKRIPIYRISSKQMQQICENKIIIDQKILDEIKEKTHLYKHKKQLKYAMLITDLNKAIGLEFDDYGNIISKSSLLLDEEEDIIESARFISETSLNFKIVNKYNINYYLTREEDFKKKYLLKELDYINKEKNHEKLTYLYEEIFKKDNLSFEEKISRLIENIKNNYNEKHNELYKIVRMTYIKK